jgi:hypothetical protein
MAQVAIVVDRHATAIHRDLPWDQRGEGGFAPIEGVVKREGHGVGAGRAV